MAYFTFQSWHKNISHLTSFSTIWPWQNCGKNEAAWLPMQIQKGWWSFYLVQWQSLLSSEWLIKKSKYPDATWENIGYKEKPHALATFSSEVTVNSQNHPTHTCMKTTLNDTSPQLWSSPGCLIPANIQTSWSWNKPFSLCSVQTPSPQTEHNKGFF